MKVKQRLKNLESALKAVEEAIIPGKNLCPEERKIRLVELTYKMGEFINSFRLNNMLH